VDKVMVCTIAQEGYVLRATLALVNGPTGAIDRTEIVDGKSAASMKTAISMAADRLLAAPASPSEASPGPQAPSGTLSLTTQPPDVPVFCPFKAVASGPEGGEARGYRTGPIGADVYINGRLVGQTPFEDGLPPGDYDFRIVKDNQIAAWTKTLVEGEPCRVRAIYQIPIEAP
jgi:hypothetical protein